MSETDLVDSTSPHGSPAVTSVPAAGTETYTTSPRACWAKSVIPTDAVVPSMATHSCSAVYIRFSGMLIEVAPVQVSWSPGPGRPGRPAAGHVRLLVRW